MSRPTVSKTSGGSSPSGSPVAAITSWSQLAQGRASRQARSVARPRRARRKRGVTRAPVRDEAVRSSKALLCRIPDRVASNRGEGGYNGERSRIVRGDPGGVPRGDRAPLRKHGTLIGDEETRWPRRDAAPTAEGADEVGVPPGGVQVRRLPQQHQIDH